MNTGVPDQAQRDLSLDPTQSFIVQAPAGSGKTELLIQRFLILLARVSEPEEVIAITFTRKAALEMRERIILALNKAALEPSQPQAIHAQKTWKLAHQVLLQNQKKSWNLLDNPGRLNIQTIDGLAHQIVRKAPLLAEFSPITDIAEDANWLYSLAVRNLLTHTHESNSLRQSLKSLLLHLNNDFSKLERLLKEMLEKRDQWLEHVIGLKKREHLENALKKTNQQLLEACSINFPKECEPTLLELMNFSARHHPDSSSFCHPGQGRLGSNTMEDKLKISTNLDFCHPWPWVSAFPGRDDRKSDDQDDDKARCSIRMTERERAGMTATMPRASIGNKEAWLAIANFLLTKNFTFRETVGESLGFPSASKASNKQEQALFKEMKAHFKALIQILKSYEPCRLSLKALIKAPALFYTEEQWQLLSELTYLLKHLLAELKWVFHEKKRVDFAEITLAARAALGTDNQPTELGLMLDYKIKHLLIDEFQDTSLAQFKFIERLIAGWEPSDGRTLFLVGDPMQSIYRFRQAEVGLFLRAQKEGIGNTPLTPIALNVNFRCDARLLSWINQQFSEIFPKQAATKLGAVSFSSSTACHEKKQTSLSSVFAHIVTSENEGDMLCELIKEKWRLDPKHRIAILVKSRSHLETIIPSLLKAELKFQALDIVSLKEQSVICDLYSLTRVLLSPIDRLAWLSVLRAPWCGLSLKDLHQLVYRTPKWDFLKILSCIPENLSEDGKLRFISTANIIASAIASRGIERTVHWIQSVWIDLKGPLCYEDTQDAKDFFDLLEKIEKEMGMIDLSHLENRLDKLFARNLVDGDERLQLMTIHKSKGLEFDSVIIPGLERKSKEDNLPILRWLEEIDIKEKSNLILAPIHASTVQEDSIYQYLGFIEKNKQKHELVRLLYVAATRAKSCLHWIMRTDTHVLDQKAPEGSLLSLLSLLNFESYQGLNSPFLAMDPVLPGQDDRVGSQDNKGIVIRNVLKTRRLKSDYFSSCLHDSIISTDIPRLDHGIQEIDSEPFQKIGNIIHQLLDQIVKQGSFQSVENELLWRKLFIQEGLLPEQFSLAIEKIRRVVKNIQNDPIGQWILCPSHQESYSEYAITIKGEETLQHLRIDRTFLDKGARWIIDYKNSEPSSHQSVEDFVEEMKIKHCDQLQKYGMALHTLYKEPIFLGLYFPLLPAWCKLEFKNFPTELEYNS